MISNLLSNIGQFTDSEVSLLEKSLQKKELPKGSWLLRENEICSAAYFLAKGAFIQYGFKDEVDQNIIDLHIPGEWMLNQTSFIRRQPSLTFIEAFTDSEVYELGIQALHELIGKSPVFFQLAKIMEPFHSRVELFDQQLTPTEKYQFVLEGRPNLLQIFPLKIIASYLKITPETLSRVREKISKERKAS